MSKEADKARKESNTRNRAAANQWQRQAESIKSDFDKNQKKLERLKKAKSKLTKDEVKELDHIKDILAKEHNIIMIRINCYKSEFPQI